MGALEKQRFELVEGLLGLGCPREVLRFIKEAIQG
jgi:hypothetical protein